MTLGNQKNSNLGWFSQRTVRNENDYEG